MDNIASGASSNAPSAISINTKSSVSEARIDRGTLKEIMITMQ